MKRSVLLCVLMLPLWGGGLAAGQSTMPPCETAPPKTTTVPSPRAPSNLRIVGGGEAELADDEEFQSGPSGDPDTGVESEHELEAVSSSPHDYYFALASRPDCHRAFSLRNQAQIEQYRRSKDQPSKVTYDFANDTDPRRQDAAKIVIGGNSLGTQVWLPTALTSLGSHLVTWDAWWGAEFNWNLTGIDQYKAFQFGSPNDEIWTEINSFFRAARLIDGALAKIEGRIYLPSAYPAATHKGPNVTATNPLAPQVVKPLINTEVWGRFWALWETDADGWDTYSLWYAEENTEPVLVFDRLQLKMRQARSSIFRLEYNTSTTTKDGPRPLVGYFRNLVVLKGISRAETLKLLQKPVK